MSKSVEKLIQYGIANSLADKAVAAGITVTKARALSQKDMVEKCGLTKDEAKVICNSVKRIPINIDVARILLERSNYTCNICKGQKHPAFIIHHIEEYEISQDNSYSNLIVLCPNDHDLAHQGGLTLKITKKQLRKSKYAWEMQVEIANAQRAARAIQIHDDAIDYINIRRIEELCVRLFKSIPKTSISVKLRALKIIGPTGSFDQKYVQSNLSGGRYLFDYMNSQETEHYKQLLQKISNVIDFADLDLEVNYGFDALSNLEGKYAFFIGGVCAKGPDIPITNNSPPVLMHYSRKRVRIEWILDPNFLMSMSAICRVGGKNRYIIYCLVRTVDKTDSKTVLVKASPLLIAQPIKYVHKTPAIAYQKQHERDVETGLDDDSEIA
jgi:hypothetical protein